MNNDIFCAGFKTDPYWWEAYRPEHSVDNEPPKTVDVAVVGGGYAGVNCALELAKGGAKTLVLDSQALGFGASTRSGGQITGGVNIGKNPSGGGLHVSQSHQLDMMHEAAEAMVFLEDLIAKYDIDCGWHKTGRITGFWIPEHYDRWAAKLDNLNKYTNARGYMVPREMMSGEIASDFYYGLMVIEQAGHLHPAMLYRGMLAAARAAGAQTISDTPVTRIARDGNYYKVSTTRGEVKAGQVVLATNAFLSSVSGPLRRSIIPVVTHMIATEPLDPEMARSLIPKNRGVAESRRVVNHYRMSPDGTRLLFGGRASFFPVGVRTTARLLYRQMVRRFPQLQGVKLSHSWSGPVALTLDYQAHIGQFNGIHYALGCNGSGVVMMSYLGHSLGKKLLSNSTKPISSFDTGDIPKNHFYYGGSTLFMPLIGSYFQYKDHVDRSRAVRGG